MSEWIGVEDRLPSSDGDYSILTASGKEYISRWNIRVLRKKIPFLPLAYDYWSIERFCHHQVTHWKSCK